MAGDGGHLTALHGEQEGDGLDGVARKEPVDKVLTLYLDVHLDLYLLGVLLLHIGPVQAGHVSRGLGVLWQSRLKLVLVFSCFLCLNFTLFRPVCYVSNRGGCFVAIVQL